MEGQMNGGQMNGGSNGEGSNEWKVKCIEGQMIEDKLKRVKRMKVK